MKAQMNSDPAECEATKPTKHTSNINSENGGRDDIKG